MSNLVLLMVLLSIVPSLIVAVVLFLRIEALRSVINTQKQGIETKFQVYDKIEVDHKTILGEYASLTNKISDAELAAKNTRLEVQKLDESVTNLTNKWNARLSAEARKRRQEAGEQVPDDEIEGTEQQELFEVPSQQQQPQQQPLFQGMRVPPTGGYTQFNRRG